MGDDRDVDACELVAERLGEALSGALPAALQTHLRGCEACAVLLAAARRHAGGAPTAASEGDDEEEDRAPAEGERPSRPTPTPKPRDHAASAKDAIEKRPLSQRVWAHRRKVLVVALLAAIGLGVFFLRKKPHAERSSANAWKGRVAAALTGGAGGVSIVDPDGATHVLAPGEPIPAGAHLRTDRSTWARLRLEDGSTIVTDRGGDVQLDSKRDRSATIAAGELVIDVVAQKDSPARLKVPGGELTTEGAKLALGVDATRVSLVVARGTVTITTDAGERVEIGAGDAATLENERISRSAGAGLGSAFVLAERDELELAPEGDTAGVPGLGELRARLPGASGGGDRSLTLEKQTVHVAIVGEIARTEIEETFRSDDDRELEGVFRFPLPADAEIERLALDVDGTLQEGAFVDAERADAIWKGVLFTAAPKQRSTHEDSIAFVWGSYHDPALLEWRAGGRMELKIFPIPKKGSRRVILSYTQHVGRVAGARRYVYSLPHLAEGKAAVDDFSFAADVEGFDGAGSVKLKGYAAEREATAARVSTSFARRAFVPTGDVVLEYATAESSDRADVVGYRQKDAPSPNGFVAITISPEILRTKDDRARTEVLVVDASRSMLGERWTRAASLAARVVEEMDPRDRFVVLSCDATCVPFAATPEVPSKQAAAKVSAFLATVAPEGGSDLVRAIESAVAIGRADGAHRSLRVIYVGDGAPTLGAISPSTLEPSVRAALPDDAAVIAVAVGVDADHPSLDALARGGGGVVIPYVAGEKSSATALSILEAAYGTMLRDVELVLPDGLEQVAPARLRSIRSGEEVAVFARTTRAVIEGTATLKGTLAGEPWSASYPVGVHLDDDAAHAFVPRRFAIARVADLERAPLTAETKAGAIALSTTYAVPSRFTSLLVLESPAMMAAFGVERRAPLSTWSPEALAAVTPSAVTTNQTFADSTTMIAPASKKQGEIELANDDDKPCGYYQPPVLPAGWVSGMKHHWFCSATYSNDPRPPSDLERRIEDARAATSTRDERAPLATLYALLAHREQLTDAQLVLSKWTTRDPFDGDAVLRWSDLAARTGDRARALRVAVGALDARPDDLELADGLAKVAALSGDARLSCALRAVHASMRPRDAEAVARRQSCLRALGDDGAADALLGSLSAPERLAVGNARIDEKTSPDELVVEATWGGGEDLDLALIDGRGARLSWLSPTRVTSLDATSPSHEKLSISGPRAGTYVIEVTRPTKVQGSPKVSGTLTLRMPGTSARSWSFSLEGVRTQVAWLELHWKDQWVPIYSPTMYRRPIKEPYPDFDY